MLPETSSFTSADNSDNESGNCPDSPFWLMARPVTRPIVSVSTPCHWLIAASEFHPSEFVQKLPPVLSWNTLRTLASASEQSGPATRETESAHSLKRTVPGMQSSSLPLKSKTRSSDRSRKLDGMTPDSRLLSIHSPVSAVGAGQFRRHLAGELVVSQP